MKTKVGDNTYELVFTVFKKPIMGYSKPYFREVGSARGILVKQTVWHGEVWYRKPEDLLNWRR